jgi:hypothetical protein
MLDLVENVNDKVVLLINDLRSTREENQRLRLRIALLEQDLRRYEARTSEAYKRLTGLADRIGESDQKPSLVAPAPSLTQYLES